nr:M60 family metallopeptidase [Bacillus cereus]
MLLIAPFIEEDLQITRVAAETKEQDTKNQVSAERVFYIEGKGDIVQLRDIDRRQFQFSPYEPTGLYANPGEKIIIQVEGTQDIQAFIGTFSYDGSWQQDSLIKSFTLQPGENTIASPTGGMIYFYNPRQGGKIQTEVKAGGVSTPYFELGKHTKDDLVNMLDKYPNAHAVELKGERALITASLDRVKKYLLGSNTDPEQLLKKIDEAIRIQDRVSGLSEKEADKHYVHYVEDNHSLGYYMYAYPHRTAYVGDAIQYVLDINKFTKEGWGPWHEAGHQRQQIPWEWEQLGEVTVNIYSMSVSRAFGNESELTKHKRYEQAFDYLNKPQPEKDYNQINDVFVQLVMFWQLDLAFGGEFYPTLHREYRSLSQAELPKSDPEKIQAFMYHASKVAKQNLLPFFDKWGLVATNETRTKIEELGYPLLSAPIWESTDEKPVKVKDDTAPDAPTVYNVTDQDEQVTGKGKAGTTVSVTVDGKEIGKATVNEKGEFTVPIPKQPAGKEVIVTLTDAAGHTSQPGKTKVDDITAPDAPTVYNVTDQDEQVTGKGEVGATVSVTVDGEEVGKATINEKGEFTVPIPKQPAGKEVIVILIDAADNISPPGQIKVQENTANQNDLVQEAKQTIDRLFVNSIQARYNHDYTTVRKSAIQVDVTQQHITEAEEKVRQISDGNKEKVAFQKEIERAKKLLQERENEQTGNLVKNGLFDSKLENWKPWIGSGATAPEVQVDGGKSVNVIKIHPNSSVEQVLTGLEPNTAYELTLYAKTENSEKFSIGMKNTGTANVSVPIYSKEYSQAHLRFKTGPNATTATVYIYKSSGTKSGYADVVTAKKAKEVLVQN